MGVGEGPPLQTRGICTALCPFPPRWQEQWRVLPTASALWLVEALWGFLSALLR